MINNREFYKKVMVLVLPMALQNLINVGVQTADVVMLGKVGETALSGSSLAGQVYFILTLFIFGLTSGAAVLTAQYWGKRDVASIEKIMNIALDVCLAISAIFTVVTLCMPETLMRIFTNEQDVIREGVSYLRIIAFSYILSCITMTFLNVLRSVERVMISTVVYLVSLIVNVIANSIFIFGFLGSPKMGIAGAALGTVIARVFEVVIVILYTKIKKLPIHIRIHGLLHLDPVLIKDFIKYALPVVVNELLWGLAMSTNASILGHLGKSVVAANSIAGVARQLAMVVSFGVANAAAIMVGKAIGEKKDDVAYIYAQKFSVLSLILGVMGSGVLMLVVPLVEKFMSLTSESQGYLEYMMFVMMIYCIGQSFNTTNIVGIFRGGGDTKFGLLADTVSMWCFSIPVSALAAFVFHAPIYVVYAILMCDETIKIPISYLRFRSKKWLRNVTR